MVGTDSNTTNNFFTVFQSNRPSVIIFNILVQNIEGNIYIGMRFPTAHNNRRILHDIVQIINIRLSPSS